MKVRVIFSAIVLSLAANRGGAQTATPPDPAKPGAEAPSDRTAFQAALKVEDPKLKIEALEKFKKDFPQSAMVSSATMNIFSTLVQKLPDQTARIQQLADTSYRAADKKAKGSMAGQFADTLLTNNLLLHDAEHYAQKSLAAMDQAEYLKDQKASYEKRKATVPSDAELIKRFKQSRATRVALLGRIEFKLGKNAAAQKLLEESYRVSAAPPAHKPSLIHRVIHKGEK